MGLSSVPCWLRPHATLSNGEQYRANLAYCVAKAKENDVILIDEYTSVVDRDVAKAMSNALQKFVRRENKKIILAS
jgi:ABC-type Mn2+/Zn2+ transport system ATPase subunit